MFFCFHGLFVLVCLLVLFGIQFWFGIIVSKNGEIIAESAVERPFQGGVCCFHCVHFLCVVFRLVFLLLVPDGAGGWSGVNGKLRPCRNHHTTVVSVSDPAPVKATVHGNRNACDCQHW